MNKAEQYMRRCLQLAAKGQGQVAPNPMVGSVLVHGDRIIGEGWHRQYGGPHAEVNCIRSVKEADRKLIPDSTLYVSLEPCAHYGKTPPCADLIVEQDIRTVVVGCVDTFSKVAGKGIERLQQAGVHLQLGVLEAECRYLNRRFFTRQELGRPYVLLKWAETADRMLAPEQGQRVMLSNKYAQTYVHKMRSEEDAILVGYRTALLDNPRLNNRYGTGSQPLRVVIDPQLALPAHLHLFDGTQPTMVLNELKEGQDGNMLYSIIDAPENEAAGILERLENVNSVIIEGGSKTLQLFLNAGLWDEAHVIQTPQIIGKGSAAPRWPRVPALSQQRKFDNNCINIYTNEHPGKLYRH
jgi:diaminohydroxyphosphoribosylaminopyrimidine deaminase/5-amino-6-(5-phosphoribosylamino)uracil reductase